MLIIYLQIFSKPNPLGYKSTLLAQLKEKFKDTNVIDIDNFSDKEIVQKLLNHLEISEKNIFVFDIRENGPKGIISLIIPFILKKKLKTTYCIPNKMMIPPWLRKINHLLTIVNRIDEIKNVF